MCVYVKNEKNGIVAGQKQPLGAVWCKTRLLNSGGQFNQLCNLINSAILAHAYIVELSSPTTMGVPRVCVRACVRACVHASVQSKVWKATRLHVPKNLLQKHM